jgi:hypothetical protein
MKPRKYLPPFGFLIPNGFAGVLFYFFFLSISYEITQADEKERVITWRKGRYKTVPRFISG